MCKVLNMVGIKNSANAWKLAIAAVPFLTARDRDAFGYAAYNPKTGLYGERWLDVKEALKTRRSHKADSQLAKLLGDAVQLEDTYNHFGDPGKFDVTALTLHARMATCAPGMINAHPFVRNGISLIHNGIISNAGMLQNISSTCDSETILNEYIDTDIDTMPSNIQFLADALEGYYSCALINGKLGYVDIFKDTRASLYVTFCEQIGGLVFCTTEEILKSAFKKLKWKLGPVVPVNPGYLMRFDAMTGERLELVKFDPSGASSYIRASDYFPNREYAVKVAVEASETANDDAPESKGYLKVGL